MFEKLFGPRPKPETPTPANSLGLGVSPEHVQNAFRAPNTSGVGFDKGTWGPADAVGATPHATQELPRTVPDQPAGDYVAAEETPTGSWSTTNPEDNSVTLPEMPEDESGAGGEMAAK